MGETLLRNVWWMLGGSARVRYDKTTDVISDRSRHKYAGYLTPLLPIAAASPDCSPRPLATPFPKPPCLLFTSHEENVLHNGGKQTWICHVRSGVCNDKRCIWYSPCHISAKKLQFCVKHNMPGCQREDGVGLDCCLNDAWLLSQFHSWIHYLIPGYLQICKLLKDKCSGGSHICQMW